MTLYEACIQYGSLLLYVGLLIQARNQLQLLDDRVRNFTKNTKSLGNDVEMLLLKELVQDQKEIYELEIFLPI